MNTLQRNSDQAIEEIECYYRRKIQLYFADPTEEGMIDKHARMEEVEFIMQNFVGLTEDRINQIYTEEYSKRYRA